MRRTLPELPAARVERFVAQYGLSRYDATVLAGEADMARFYEELAAQGVDPKLAANWVMGEYSAHLNAAGLAPGHGHVTAARLAALLRLVADGTVSGTAAKQVFALMVEERGEASDIVGAPRPGAGLRHGRAAGRGRGRAEPRIRPRSSSSAPARSRSPASSSAR